MRVVVIGAGIAGLTAARTLHDRSGGEVEVTVVERARSVGGRMATRRIGAATFDHGAQFFTVRTPELQTRVDDWLARGLARVWNHGFEAGGDGYPRYAAPAGMTSLAKDIAVGLRVECASPAFTVRRAAEASHGSPWEVVIDDGTVRPADAVIVTTPLPQAFGLLADTELDLDVETFRVDYDRTICLLAVLDRPVLVSASGGAQPTDGMFSFVGDNASKHVSAVPAVTFHAGPAWSEARWDDPLDHLGSALLEGAAPWLAGAHVLDHQVKKWRFATPRTIHPDACRIVNPGEPPESGPIVLAGDAFAGPRIEGAHNSGLAAAHALLHSFA